MNRPANRRSRRPILVLAVLAVIAGILYLIFRNLLTVPPEEAVSRGKELLQKKTVLAVVAHPDDLEWYIGGTLHRLAQAGANVQVVVASSGEKGPNRFDAPNLPGVREQEQSAAGKINGYTRIHFLRLPDRGVAKDPRFVPEVTRIFNEVRPDAVFVFDPDYPSLPYLHADHQGSARLFLGFWNTLGADRPPVYLFQTRRPDVAVDISDAIETKALALSQHRSQYGNRDPNGGRMLEVFRSEGSRVGVEFAELFRLLR
ncbi:PIG-L deacetylase family protein [Deinococcus cellulosilyticus]|uniref:GlcNAc-PI de-N-acetylase n=1 Tax=Deinococcus cellulosilyticus (strain DSM 18568 / NBRC 106333 / KACC 11606 / 5516J-15) TaxID=1223518 RepID=A0A511N5Z3_DEIC1|nr:PIG-L deacetylase family protein [Deinococcus cellulosilyticus]GEM47888.1 GlcNAc-PI de-N-acetylase [Deinococcus cellulosilyticus NBRC 106333 = KACC 11606]